MSNAYRVSVNFPEPERDLLQALCMADFRPPDDQLRYLVFSEAKRRGILTDPNKHESATPALTGSGGGFVTPHPQRP